MWHIAGLGVQSAGQNTALCNSKKKPKGLAQYPSDDLLSLQSCHGTEAGEQNPTQGCALPKMEHKEVKTLTADQLSAFFREAKESGVYELYYLDLATGLRRGELLGLKWSDVDFDRSVLKIQRAISRQNGRAEDTPTQNKNPRNLTISRIFGTP